MCGVGLSWSISSGVPMHENLQAEHRGSGGSEELWERVRSRSEFFRDMVRVGVLQRLGARVVVWQHAGMKVEARGGGCKGALRQSKEK